MVERDKKRSKASVGMPVEVWIPLKIDQFNTSAPSEFTSAEEKESGYLEFESKIWQHRI